MAHLGLTGATVRSRSAGTNGRKGAQEVESVAEELAFGVWQTKEGERTTLEVRNLAAYRAILGDDLVIGFAQLFGAVNRIEALHSMMLLNNHRGAAIVIGELEHTHDPDSVGAARNRVVIGLFIWGVLHELSSAIDTLQGAKLTDVLREGKDKSCLASWKELRSIAHRWRGGQETDGRNQLAFHLGDREVFRKGLNAWHRPPWRRLPPSLLSLLGIKVMRGLSAKAIVPLCCVRKHTRRAIAVSGLLSAKARQRQRA